MASQTAYDEFDKWWEAGNSIGGIMVDGSEKALVMGAFITAWDEATSHEREACAKIAEGIGDQLALLLPKGAPDSIAAHRIAKAIRSRNNSAPMS